MLQNSKHTSELEYDGEYSITAPWGSRRVTLAKVVRPAWHEDNHKADLEAAKNARLIVNACNSHYELVGALDACIKSLQAGNNLSADVRREDIRRAENAIASATGQEVA